MAFRIAGTFTASLTRLTGEEQKAVKTTAFDLQPDLAMLGDADVKIASPEAIRELIAMRLQRLDHAMLSASPVNSRTYSSY